MPHIHTEPGQHDHTVTAYIIRSDGGDPRALMHMHKKLNRLMPIGGHVELDETPWQSIAHELSEESGYELDDLKILQPPGVIRALSRVALHPYPVAMNTHDFFDDRAGEHFHSDTAYAFVANGGPGHDVGEGESTDLRWLSESELDAIKSELIFENTREIYKFIFETCLRHWEQADASTYRK